MKNSVAGDKLKSELEFKAEDALLGLGKGFTLPVTKKYDGKVNFQESGFMYTKLFRLSSLSSKKPSTPTATS